MQWTPIFSGLSFSVWTVSVFVAVVLAMVLFVVLRKYESQLVSPAVSRSLLLLRLSVLVLLLLTFLKPVLTRSADVDKQQRLIVAVDVSESMDTADRHAAPEEMLRWAQALGMLGNAGSRELLDRWVAAWESGQQPDWNQPADGGEKTDGADALGDLRRQQMQDVFDEIGRMPRTEFVRRLLQSQPGSIMEQWAQDRLVNLRVFAADQHEIQPQQLADVLNSDRSDLRPGATDVVQLLASAIGETSSHAVQGIVLLSDGRQTAASDVAAEAARLNALGVPVYCVPIGSRLAPRDLSIAAVQLPQTVFLDDTALLQATITSTGYSGDRVTVQLQKDGKVVDQKTVTVAADSFDVEFAIPTDTVGHQQYTLSTDPQPGELRTDNNQREITLSVIDNQSHVLLVEGDARWEFRYLKAALERDKRVALSTVLIRQPFLQLLNRPFLDSQLPDSETFEQQLATTDILIMGDVPPTEIPEAAWQAISKAVSDDGLTLLIVPGSRHMPHRYDSDILNQLLPISNARQQLAERYKRSLPDAAPSVFRLQPATDTSDLALFDFSDGNAEQQMTLAGLPGHPWAYTGDAKPAASVWASLNIEGVRLDSELPAIVHQYFGFGQVVWMGIDSTWRWRQRAGDTWHHRFWGQIVRWAARNKSAAGNDQVRMNLSGVVVDDTDTVDVSVRFNPRLMSQIQDATVEVVVTPVSEADATNPNQNNRADSDPPAAESVVTHSVMLLPLQGASDRFVAKLPALSPGSYEVELKLGNTQVQLQQPVKSELLVRQQLSSELANISCHREFLQQLANQTNGELLQPWQLAELPERLTTDTSASNTVQEITLWDHWVVMLLFFALLTAEWILRKLHGLP